MKPFLAALLFTILAAGAPGQTSVWTIRENGNTVYLAGSAHILREKDFPLPAAFDAAFEEADILVLEADIDGVSNAHNMPDDFRRLFWLENGETLRDRLSGRTCSLLEKKAAELSIPMESISNMRPVIALTVLSTLKLMHLGFSLPGVDMHYLAMAKEKSMPLMYLESVAAHLEAALAMGDGEEEAYVLSSLKGLDDAGPELAEILEAWRGGTGGVIERGLEELAGQFPETYRRTVADRNHAWLPLIVSYLASPETEFVIAGAAHFYGPDGLLALLAGAGYAVEQVN
ncbi:MAG: TraB/GumN family protein [Spirochaetaceae bacterium]|jgi:uncharacterized protein YbaP (TraB family)|nr:TraB/GumN family protein [Spirochaetaceae bacterium]